MKITKTPFRMSLFGGGSDYPRWFLENPSVILAAAIDYHCYISLRRLPPFSPHLSKAVYSKIEKVDANVDFQHPSIRECLRRYFIQEGVELHHDSDVPARTGIGSSSSFTVGMLKAIHEYKGIKDVSPIQLAKEAIDVEQNMIGEAVGVQDQIIAAFGGIKKIILGPKGIESVEDVPITKEYKTHLEKNILFGFTGNQRISNDYSSILVKRMADDLIVNNMREMVNLSREAISSFAKEADIDVIGKYLMDAWRLKTAMNTSGVPAIFDKIQEVCFKYGALGGKIMGAGGGGAFYFLVPHYHHEKIKQSLPMVKVWLPVKFSDNGSQVIFSGE